MMLDEAALKELDIASGPGRASHYQSFADMRSGIAIQAAMCDRFMDAAHRPPSS